MMGWLRRLFYRNPDTCPSCDGSGLELIRKGYGEVRQNCWRCDGIGTISA